MDFIRVPENHECELEYNLNDFTVYSVSKEEISARWLTCYRRAP